MTARLVRLFVSSPSDVKPERDRAVIVIDRLNGIFDGLVRIELIRWEDDFYSSSLSFQEQINNAVGKMAEVDILVCILWGRIGSRLSPALWRRDDEAGYESGTVYEYETALALSKANGGVPDVYLFRKSGDILYRAEHAAEDIEQHKLLERVWQRWTQNADGYNAAGYQSFADTDAFEAQLEGCLRQWLERQGIAVKGVVWDRRIQGSPFCGLAAFDTRHSSVFFGRDGAIASAIGKLRTSAFLLLIGASGSGKSSLLRAGLLPRVVRPGMIPDVDLWRKALMTPSADPFLDLAQALLASDCLKAELGDIATADLADCLRRTDDGALRIRGALDQAAARRAAVNKFAEPRPARLFLAIDQLERLFIEAPASDIEPFAKLIRALSDGGIASIAATMRSDTYASFQAIPDFAALKEAGATHDLLPPDAVELEDIVMRPIAACHPPLAFEQEAAGKSLAEVLIRDAKGGDFLPLLQMTLEQLFQAEKARGDGWLRISDYDGIDQAVNQVASDAYAAIGDDARSCVPALITALVHDISLDPISGQRSITLQPVARARFEQGHPERAALVDAFVARRLLTVEDFAGESRIRAVHDALLRVWPEAVAVLTENEAIIRVRRTLEPLVDQWTGSGRSADSDLLLTSPALLAGSRQLVARLGDDVPAPMRDYITASLTAEEERAARDAQQRTAIMSATGSIRARSIPYYRLVAGILIVFLLGVRIANLPLVEWLSWVAFDSFQRISPRVPTSRPVTIVDIDEKSMREIGQWPWPRTVLANLVDRLTEDGAVAIGFDIVFAEPDQMSPDKLATSISGLDLETRDKLSKLESNDQVFADAIRRAKHVAVAESGVGEPASPVDDAPTIGIASLGEGDINSFVFTFPGLLRSIKPIEQAAEGRGLITTVVERDGVLRRFPAILRAGGLLYPTLPVELLRIVSGTRSLLVRTDQNGLRSVGLRGFSFPTDGNGRMWMHYSGHIPARFVSATDVLSRSVSPERVKGKLVIVGSSAVGLNDLRTTPVSRATPGSEINAEVIENILTGSLLSRPSWLIVPEVALVAIIGVLFSFLMPMLSARVLAIVSMVISAAILGGSFAAFKYWRLLIDPVYPLPTTAIFVLVLTFFIYRHSESQRGKIRAFFEPKRETAT